MLRIEIPSDVQVTIRSLRGKAAYNHLQGKVVRITDLIPQAGGMMARIELSSGNVEFIEAIDLSPYTKKEEKGVEHKVNDRPATSQEMMEYSEVADRLIRHFLISHSLDHKQKDRFNELTSKAWKSNLYKEESA